MRILQLHTRYRQRGGEDEVVDAEARVLRQAGHDVHQVIAQNPGNPAAAGAALAFSPWNPIMSRRVKSEVEGFRPDVAHIHNTWFAMSPSVIAAIKAAGVPVVMTLHNYRLTCANALLFRDGSPCELCIRGRPWQAVRYGCYRDSRLASIPAAATIDIHRRRRTWEETVDLMIAVSDFQKRLLIRAGLPSGRVVVKPHFVQDSGSRIHPPSLSGSVLYVGRLSAEKGVRQLLSAWRECARSMNLVVVGRGPEGRALEDCRVPGVRFVGQATPDEVRRIMRSSRALILPSDWYEPFGLVVLEAFAAGLPTVVSDRGAPAELVRRVLGESWVFQAGDAESLQAALRRVEDDDLVDSSGLQVRRTFETEFTEKGASQLLMKVYRSLIEK